MRIACTLAVVLAAAVLARSPAADQPARPKLPPGFDPAAMADPKAAAAAADWLEKEYPAGRRPEAVRMLVGILRGMKPDGSNGWFDPAATRYTWDWLRRRCGDPKAEAIPRDAFPGPAALFDRLDRDGDGRVTPADLDWSAASPYVQQAAGVLRLLRRVDATGDGKVTREELDAFFRQVAKGKEGATAEDLRDALIPRGPGGFGPGDEPSVPALVRGLFSGELGSMAEGPNVGDPAPDFTLKTADGVGTVTLSKLVGPKPVVLVLGNFTCSPFRALYPDVEAAYRRHKDAATFQMVYVREAHPTDGWRMAANDRLGVAVAQPTTAAERAKACGLFCQKLSPALPVAVDEVTDPVGHGYSGMPARLYVIDRDGTVAYKGGRGPFGFKPGEMEQALVMSLLDAVAGPPARR